jgi:hypothetical protein
MVGKANKIIMWYFAQENLKPNDKWILEPQKGLEVQILVL